MKLINIIKVYIVISVESPNDKFQLVRDFVDVSNFYNLKTFNLEKLKNWDYQEMVNEFKAIYKINPVFFKYIFVLI